MAISAAVAQPSSSFVASKGRGGGFSSAVASEVRVRREIDATESSYSAAAERLIAPNNPPSSRTGVRIGVTSNPSNRAGVIDDRDTGYGSGSGRSHNDGLKHGDGQGQYSNHLDVQSSKSAAEMSRRDRFYVENSDQFQADDIEYINYNSSGNSSNSRSNGRGNRASRTSRRERRQRQLAFGGGLAESPRIVRLEDSSDLDSVLTYYGYFVDLVRNDKLPLYF